MKAQASTAARLREARTELARAERALATSARPWWNRVQRHRSALAGAGGFALGLALTLLPLRWWTRTGAAAGAATATLARSGLLPLVIGAILEQIRADKQASPARQPAPDAQTGPD